MCLVSIFDCAIKVEVCLEKINPVTFRTYKPQQENINMNNETDTITNLIELETFLTAVESGGLGLTNVTGVAMATNNKDGRRFVAVLDDKQQLLLSRWITEEVFQTGQDRVRNGPSLSTH
jgi:hypothetical protein